MRTMNKMMLAMGMVMSTGLLATPAMAETVPNTNSNATITALPGGDEAIKPVDPTNPTDPNGENPNPPAEGNETGNTGSLQINYVSHLNFGNDIKLDKAKVSANLKNTGTPFFQVSDLRGTGAGWALNVTLGDFTSTNATQNKTIKGATISFKNGVAKTSNEPDENGAAINPATVTNPSLTAGSTAAVTFMNATSGMGRGTDHDILREWYERTILLTIVRSIRSPI